MENTKIQSKKLSLQNDTPSPLKIYLFILREQEIKIDKEKSVIVLAYDLDSAFAKALQVSDNWNVNYHGQSMPVKDLIDNLHLQGAVLPQQELDSNIVKVPEEKLGLKKFKECLLLSANDLVKNSKDKKKLKEIISRL